LIKTNRTRNQSKFISEAWEASRWKQKTAGLSSTQSRIETGYDKSRVPSNTINQKEKQSVSDWRWDKEQMVLCQALIRIFGEIRKKQVILMVGPSRRFSNLDPAISLSHL
jgi:hypothetical protein